MVSKFKGLLLVSILILSSWMLSVQANDFVGTWEGSTDTPEGPDSLSMTLEIKDSVLCGRMNDSLGLTADVELLDLTVKDKTLTFRITIPDPGTGMMLDVYISLELSGSTLTGSWSIPEGPAGTITMQKKT